MVRCRRRPALAKPGQGDSAYETPPHRRFRRRPRVRARECAADDPRGRAASRRGGPNRGGFPRQGAPNAKPTGKQARAQCRAQAKAQGLTGDARKQAVQDCFAAARPDLAQAQKCRQQAKANGLQGTQLKAFIQQCKTTAQSSPQ